MALISCPHCRRNVNTLHAVCPSCGKPVAATRAIQPDRLLGAAELFGGLAYFTGLIWMALDSSRPLLAVLASAVGGAAILAGRLFRSR
ncbi:MAG: hypothetical protein AB1916_10525 [Thermodesulfobacteriota bacterium]